jgi:hypothetical protein
MKLIRHVLVAGTLAWLGFFAIGVHPRDRPTG